MLFISGCSAVWLARFVRDEEVVGSNPATPIFLEECMPVFFNPQVRTESTTAHAVSQVHLPHLGIASTPTTLQSAQTVGEDRGICSWITERVSAFIQAIKNFIASCWGQSSSSDPIERGNEAIHRLFPRALLNPQGRDPAHTALICFMRYHEDTYLSFDRISTGGAQLLDGLDNQVEQMLRRHPVDDTPLEITRLIVEQKPDRTYSITSSSTRVDLRDRFRCNMNSSEAEGLRAPAMLRTLVTEIPEVPGRRELGQFLFGL